MRAVLAPQRPVDQRVVAAVGRIRWLSGREREVLWLLATGEANRWIGRELSIAERTVKAHVANIVGKLGLGSRTEAAIVGFAWLHGCFDGHATEPAARS